MAGKTQPSLGKNCCVDEGVLLGVPSGRQFSPQSPLRVGPSAILRSGSVLYRSTNIGARFETGHGVIVREQNKIGNDVCIWNYSTIDYGCRIGNRVKIHCNCYIAQYAILEDDVFLAPGVVLANDLFPGSKLSGKLLQGPILRRGAHIGINCTILPGVVIGEGALIGAGSVVTRSVPARSVAFGNPARIHKNRNTLRWPSQFSFTRPAVSRFYAASAAGRRAF